MHRSTPLLLASCCSLLALPLYSQTRTPSPPTELVRLEGSPSAAAEDALRERAAAFESDAHEYLANSHLLAGEPISIGLDWKATYTRDGMRFTPLLGKQAPHTRTLSFRFLGLEVGGRALAGLDLEARPELAGDAVVYARGQGLTEVYEARQEGLEQSFVLETLPARDADLVVRGELTTDLVPATAHQSGTELRFTEPGIASVRIDTVVAFDADGDRVEGILRQSGSVLEIVIPAAFVATADLPLVVDPLFGVEHDGTDGTFEADQVDVAFGASSFDEYALVFTRYYSATDPDISAATYTNFGTTGLLLLAVESTVGTFDQEPSIAYNLGEEQFAVAWQRANTPSDPNDVLFSTFDASSGVVEATISLASGDITDENHPDVGGEDQLGFDRAVVVYQAEEQIRVASVQVPDGATPVLVTTNTVFSGGDHDYPAISKSGGSSGRYFVVAERDFGIDRDLRFGMVDYIGTVLATGGTLTTSGPDEERPDVAGDGEVGMVVFQREAAAGNGDNDIWARKLEYDAVNDEVDLDPETIIVEGELDDDELEPAIGLSGNEYLIAWADQVGAGFVYDVFATTVGKDTCLVCEPEVTVSAPVLSNREPEIGTRQAGGDATEGEAAIAYTRTGGVPNDQIFFHVWENQGTGSSTLTFGGGCGEGGVISLAGSDEIGSTDFVVNLSSASAISTIAVLNINAPGGEFACGPCTVLPLKFLSTQATAPGPGGTKQASQPFQIPCKGALAGKSVAFQWIVLPTVSSPCALDPNISLSNRIQLTLGF